jgi:glyoxylase-like metal-dependent hydrolase (beta-lactamase superfamily II)
MPNKKLTGQKVSGACREIAPDVFYMESGKGIYRSNVYFVRSGTSWVLIDASSTHCGEEIKQAAESLFGAGTRPACILITHDHPDHAGSILELVRYWKCVVYFHPDELELAVNSTMETMKKYANPLDHWVIFPLLRLMPPGKRDAMLAGSSLKGVAQAFDPAAGVPGLPDWQCIHTPGHMPGHVAFFRSRDRVLITGDAVLTVRQNSLWAMLLWMLKKSRTKISNTIWISTWNWKKAKESVMVMAALEPRVLAPGHGLPITGGETARELRALAERITGHPVGKQAKK